MSDDARQGWLALTPDIFISLRWSLDSTQSNWPQWRGPEGHWRIPRETAVPLERPRAADKNVVWKTPLSGHGHSQPIVWGDHIFLTAAVEGEVVPGAKAVTHVDEGKEFLHPDSVGADRKHTLKVLAVESKNGKIRWERTAWEGRSVRQPAQAQQLCGADADYRRHAGLRMVRFRRTVHVRLQRHARVEEIAGRAPHARDGHG